MRSDSQNAVVIVAALVGGLALFVAGFFIAAEMRSATASPAAGASGRLITLGTQTVEGLGAFEVPLTDVSDCRRLFLMANIDPATNLRVLELGHTSPDGTTLIGAKVSTSRSTLEEWGTLSAELTGFWPYLSFPIENGSGYEADITAWLWCDTDSSGAAVGGIADLPPIAGMGGSPAHNYAIAAVLAFVAVVAFAAGGWYARRRWVR